MRDVRKVSTGWHLLKAALWSTLTMCTKLHVIDICQIKVMWRLSGLSSLVWELKQVIFFKQNMLKMSWFQLLKSVHLMHVFVLRVCVFDDNILNIFSLTTNKQLEYVNSEIYTMTEKLLTDSTEMKIIVCCSPWKNSIQYVMSKQQCC